MHNSEHCKLAIALVVVVAVLTVKCSAQQTCDYTCATCSDVTYYSCTSCSQGRYLDTTTMQNGGFCQCASLADYGSQGCNSSTDDPVLLALYYFSIGTVACAIIVSFAALFALGVPDLLLLTLEYAQSVALASLYKMAQPAAINKTLIGFYFYFYPTTYLTQNFSILSNPSQ